MRFSSATLDGTSSLVAASLLGAKEFVTPPNGLSSTFSFSFTDFFGGRPLLGPEGFGAPFARTGGSDKVVDTLPVDAFAALFLVGAMECGE